MIRLGRELFDLICFDKDGGGAEPPADPPADLPADPPADPPPETPPAYEPHPYQAQARGDFKTDEFFKDFTDITSVMESLKKSRAEITELTANPPVKAPEVPETYKLLDNSEVDGVSLEPEEVETLQANAAAISATQEQFEAMVKSVAADKKAQSDFILERRDASVKMLQDLWPSEKEYKEGWARYNAAADGLEKAGIKGVRKLMENPSYGDNAVLIRVLSEFGRFFTDDTLLDGNGGIIPNQNKTGQLTYTTIE